MYFPPFFFFFLTWAALARIGQIYGKTKSWSCASLSSSFFSLTANLFSVFTKPYFHFCGLNSEEFLTKNKSIKIPLFSFFFYNLGIFIRFVPGIVAGSSCHYGKNSSVCRQFLACVPEDTGNPVACVCRMSQKQHDKAGVSFLTKQ